MKPNKPLDTQDDFKGDEAPLARRLLWFAALWLAGVISLAVIAFGLRFILKP